MTNPALEPLVPLLGSWQLVLHGAAFLPDPDDRVQSTMSVEWIADGAAIVMRQGGDEGSQRAVWLIGRDDGGLDYEVLYADSRGVSRIYQMSFDDAVWRMWRSTPAFSQRFEAAVAPDGQSMRGEWATSTDGAATWEHDFYVDYRRDVATPSPAATS